MILHVIIDEYIRYAEPVGSRSISKRSDVGFSSATIRNEMADLEELGFLKQPHTSAGRIPSQKGYRYYVDHLIQLGRLSTEDMERLKSLFAEKIIKMEEITQHAASILSQMTNYTSIALGPKIFETCFHRFQLLPLDENTAVAMIVTNTGHVENKIVPMPVGMSITELDQVIHLLNTKLVGVPLYKLRSQLYLEIGHEMGRYISQVQQFMTMVESLLMNDDKHREVFLSGTANILTQPEFKDVDKVKTIWQLLEETQTLVKVIGSTSTGVQVRIGKENPHEAIINCSLITTTYIIAGKTIGTIGILGPTRMEYAKVMNLMNHLTSQFTQLLQRLDK